VAYAQLLNDASEVFFHTPHEHQASIEGGVGETLTLDLPITKPPVTIPVVELYLK
jgi:alpha-L-fucosidase